MRKLLVIDDEPIVRISSKRTLAHEGYDVTLAESGRAGIEIAHVRRDGSGSKCHHRA